jgi:hypothetical protein
VNKESFEALERDEARVRCVLRSFRAEAAAEALQHWDAIMEGLKALEALNSRTCDYAARVVGSEARIERSHYSLTRFEDEQDDEGDELPGISDLRITDAHRTEASRVDLATTASYESEMRQGGAFPVLDAVDPYDPSANDQDVDEDEAGLPPLPFEDDIVLSDGSFSSASSTEDEEDEE